MVLFLFLEVCLTTADVVMIQVKVTLYVQVILTTTSLVMKLVKVMSLPALPGAPPDLTVDTSGQARAASCLPLAIVTNA
jgi:hypothetical protein